MFKSLNRGVSAPIAIIIIVVCAVLVGGIVVWQYYGIPKEEEKTQEEIPADEIAEKEQDCIDSGGTVSTSVCCKTTDDFPNLCFIGPCGCSLENSHEVKICDCGPDKCFDGNGCVPREISEEPYIEVLSPNGGEIFEEGQDIPITWISEEVNNVYIHAYYYDENNNKGNPEEFSFNSGECRLTYEPVSAATGRYITGGSSRCGKMPAGNRIKIEVSGQAIDIKDQSDDYFSIVIAD